MSKIDEKYFNNLYHNVTYNYKDKEENTFNNVLYMLNRSLAMFNYHNLPDTMPKEEIEKQLQCKGFGGVVKVGENLYCLDCNLGGENDMYNRPTKGTFAIPYLNFNGTFEIDKDFVLIKNDTLGIGLLPIYEKYCSLITETVISLYMALINKRTQLILTATDDNTYNSAKSFVEKLVNGELSVIQTNKMFDDSLKGIANGNGNGTNTLTEIYNILKMEKADLYNEIGLNAVSNTKRERISNAELELNSDSLYPFIDNMLNERRVAVEKINAMYGTDIEVELNSSWDYRIFNGKSIHNTDSEIDESEVEQTITDGENVSRETSETDGEKEKDGEEAEKEEVEKEEAEKEEKDGEENEN